jgi:hypothetical protein
MYVDKYFKNVFFLTNINIGRNSKLNMEEKCRPIVIKEAEIFRDCGDIRKEI